MGTRHLASTRLSEFIWWVCALPRPCHEESQHQPCWLLLSLGCSAGLTAEWEMRRCRFWCSWGKSAQLLITANIYHSDLQLGDEQDLKSFSAQSVTLQMCFSLNSARIWEKNGPLRSSVKQGLSQVSAWHSQTRAAASAWCWKLVAKLQVPSNCRWCSCTCAVLSSLHAETEFNLCK